MKFAIRMVIAFLALLIASGFVFGESQPNKTTIAFDKTSTGQLPAGWVGGVTGQGSPKWSVEADATAPSKPNVLKQSGEGTYPWCVKKDVSLKDGFVEVKFKPISGKEDQAGGLLTLSIAFGLSLSIVTSATSASIADLSSAEGRGSAMGLLGSVMDIGHTTGPLASGFIAASFGYGRAFVGAALVLLLIAFVFLSVVGTPKHTNKRSKQLEQTALFPNKEER